MHRCGDGVSEVHQHRFSLRFYVALIAYRARRFGPMAPHKLNSRRYLPPCTITRRCAPLHIAVFDRPKGRRNNPFDGTNDHLPPPEPIRDADPRCRSAASRPSPTARAAASPHVLI
jgi:hypothetical protein